MMNIKPENAAKRAIMAMAKVRNGYPCCVACAILRLSCNLPMVLL